MNFNCGKNVLYCSVEESFKNLLHLNPVADDIQNLISSFMSIDTFVEKFSWNPINGLDVKLLTDRPTDRQTDRPTDRPLSDKPYTSLVYCLGFVTLGPFHCA